MLGREGKISDISLSHVPRLKRLMVDGHEAGCLGPD
jgi:hypothetical protein